MIIYLLRANNERDYKAGVAYLMEKGFKWEGKELSYEDARDELGNDKRKIMLLEARHLNDYNKGKTGTIIRPTYLSKVNKLQRLFNRTEWTMQNVQTIIPQKYYNL